MIDPLVLGALVAGVAFAIHTVAHHWHLRYKLDHEYRMQKLDHDRELLATDGGTDAGADADADADPPFRPQEGK